jgi:hypothetical protein
VSDALRMQIFYALEDLLGESTNLLLITGNCKEEFCQVCSSDFIHHDVEALVVFEQLSNLQYVWML